MDEDQSLTTHKQCVACKEEILMEALVCPKCRSKQKPPKWEKILISIKWIGGITALISLIIGVRQVSGIVKDWKERDESVRQIVTASKMLVEMKDYQAAWQLSKNATKLAPSSKDAFIQHVDVAMSFIRNIRAQKGDRTYTEIIDPLIMTLSQAAGDENNDRSAAALAHIGWANFWRLKDKKADYEVEEYLLKALEYSPENTYGNLFRGLWLLDIQYEGEYMRFKDDKDKLTDAMSHFRKALEVGENPTFVNELIISSLTGTSVYGADVEAIKIANEWRIQDVVPVEESERKSTFNRLLGEFKYLYRNQLSEGSFLPRLNSELSNQEIIDTYLWVLEGSENDTYINAKFLNLGLISEAGNDLKGAFYYNIKALNIHEEFYRNYGSYAANALCRLVVKCLEDKSKESDIPITDVIEIHVVESDQLPFGFKIGIMGSVMSVFKVSNGLAIRSGFEVGDLLLMVDNEPLKDESMFYRIMRDLISGNRPYANLLILREGKLLKYRFKI